MNRRLRMAEQALKGQMEAPESDQSTEGGKREKSTIQFPYLSLEEAVTIAMGVHALGNSCQTEQLAAHLNQKPNSGTFRLKLLTAKMFGLLTYSMGHLTLTPLGSRICDPQQDQAARVEAFLNIPLYQRVHEQFRGVNLPPSAGLEAAMVTMGVSPKQKATARQVFQRSAQYAGFFWSGTGRLVLPPGRGATAGAAATSSLEQNGGAPADATIVEKPRGGGYGGDGSDGGGCDPAIHGLIKRLPPPDSDWPLDKQARWLLAISHAFDVIYPREDDGRSLRIEIVKD
jgi:hypothetical protein